MAIYKLLLPKMGESVSEATLTKWVKQVGEHIDEDDAVVELATDKVDSEVPSPVSGILKERLFEENQVVQVGDVIALIEIEGPEIENQEPQSTSQEEDHKSSDTPVDSPSESNKRVSPKKNWTVFQALGVKAV